MSVEDSCEDCEKGDDADSFVQSTLYQASAWLPFTQSSPSTLHPSPSQSRHSKDTRATRKSCCACVGPRCSYRTPGVKGFRIRLFASLPSSWTLCPESGERLVVRQPSRDRSPSAPTTEARGPTTGSAAPSASAPVAPRRTRSATPATTPAALAPVGPGRTGRVGELAVNLDHLLGLAGLLPGRSALL